MARRMKNSGSEPDPGNQKSQNERLIQLSVYSQRVPYINRRLVLKKFICFLQKFASLLLRAVVTVRYQEYRTVNVDQFEQIAEILKGNGDRSTM